jgi:ribosomal protein L14E/L6E/L27E
MITKEQYQQRIDGLNKAIEQSRDNHNALVGRKLEAEETLKHIKNLEAESQLQELTAVENMEEPKVHETMQ